MASAETVARYFLWLAEREAEAEPVTHLRLQKLLYYVQGWCLASRGRTFFDSEIQAWQHGPVVRDVYPKFADFERRAIPASEARDGEELEERDKALVEWVWGRYGKYSAGELRRRTHAEKPWKEARGKTPEDEPSGTAIKVATMEAFFREEYRKHCDGIGMNGEQMLGALDDARAGRTIPWEQMVEEMRRGVAP